VASYTYIICAHCIIYTQWT